MERVTSVASNEGRSGLRVPEIRIPELDYDDTYASKSVVRFFYDLWAANSLPVPQKLRDPFEARLIVPASGDKPLVIIESARRMRDSQDVHDDKVRGNTVFSSRKWHTPGVAFGTEKHGIYTPPDITGPPVPVLTMESVLDTSLESEPKYTWHGEPAYPDEIDRPIGKNGQSLETEDFEETQDYYKTLDAQRYELSKTYFQGILSQTVELLMD